jgi:hypothetical protein
MYYFAYGANMDSGYLAKYIGNDNIHIIGPAHIENYIFRYRDVKVDKLKSGVANIEPRKGSKTYGIIYYFDSPALLANIDIREGYISNNHPGNIYNKITLDLILHNPVKKVRCIVYTINDLAKLGIRKPRLKYLSYLINGHRMNDLPREHLQRINYLDK